jgi:hypothetical protein
MSDTTFVDFSTPAVNADWLNDVNNTVYRALGNAGVAPTTAGQVISNLNLAALFATTASVAAVETAVLGMLAAPSGSTLVGITQNGTGAVSRTVTAKGTDWISAFDFMTSAQIADVKARTQTIDVSNALQNAVTAAQLKGVLYLPAGVYRVGTSIAIPTSVQIQGAGNSTCSVTAWGVDAFTIAAGLGNVTIRDFNVISVTNVGGTDPKLYNGIACNGTNGSHVNYVTLENIYFQGWQQCVNFAYTWNSSLHNITTINSTYGVRCFGQSVNNAITNSRLIANSGTASIVTVKDVGAGGLTGQGWVITNTLLSSGTYGVISDGFLSMSFSSCVTDLIQDTAFYFSGVASSISYIGGWVYAANYGFRFADLGAAAFLGNTICPVYLQTTAANSIGLYWGTNCQGLSISGGTLIAPNQTSVYCIYINGGSVSFGAVSILDNSNSTHAVYINGTDIHGTENISGSYVIQWNVSPIATIASAATIPAAGQLVSSPYNSYFLSGAATVNTITASSTWIGKTITLISTGTPTVASGAGNITMVGGSVVMANNQAIRLIWNGSAWNRVQ